MAVGVLVLLPVRLPVRRRVPVLVLVLVLVVRPRSPSRPVKA